MRPLRRPSSRSLANGGPPDVHPHRHAARRPRRRALGVARVQRERRRRLRDLLHHERRGPSARGRPSTFCPASASSFARLLVHHVGADLLEDPHRLLVDRLLLLRGEDARRAWSSRRTASAARRPPSAARAAPRAARCRGRGSRAACSMYSAISRAFASRSGSGCWRTNSDAGEVAEVRLLQPGEPVEPEALDHRAVPVRHEPVGQEVDADVVVEPLVQLARVPLEAVAPRRGGPPGTARAPRRAARRCRSRRRRRSRARTRGSSAWSFASTAGRDLERRHVQVARDAVHVGVPAVASTSAAVSIATAPHAMNATRAPARAGRSRRSHVDGDRPRPRPGARRSSGGNAQVRDEPVVEVLHARQLDVLDERRQLDRRPRARGTTSAPSSRLRSPCCRRP